MCVQEKCKRDSKSHCKQMLGTSQVVNKGLVNLQFDGPGFGQARFTCGLNSKEQLSVYWHLLSSQPPGGRGRGNLGFEGSGQGVYKWQQLLSELTI